MGRVVFVDGIVKGFSEALGRERIEIDGEGAALHPIVSPEVVCTHNVIGVKVRVKDCIDVIDLLGQALKAEVRWRIDDD